ncbi:MAG: hypothetical protein P4L41_01795 [Flavipsychrobacter sp.]|nr:hypothetical protein [Flavipsychrobacter sp.]
MKYLKLALCLAVITGASSCASTTKQDNATNNADTMVIKNDRTDSATKSISTDTTKR